MANYRIPGPTCGENQPWSIKDGTLARQLTPPSGPVCAESSLYPTQALLGLLSRKSDSDLRFLFQQCLNPATGLSDADYEAAARSLRIEVAAIKAIAEIESSGSAFDESGRPRILFERHYFHRLTCGKYTATHHDISNKSPGGYGRFSMQYAKLERAYDLAPDAALRSASWGRFQIMGDNFRAAGFESVRDFVCAMTKSESEHLKAFVNFVGSSNEMVAALRNKDWPGFAAKYNGREYKKNSYDTKLKDAYDRFKSADAKVPATKP